MDAEIYTVRPPQDTIVVVPTSLDYIYERANGHDVLAVLMDTKRAGPLLIALSPENARHIAAHLDGMVDQLDELRAEWNSRNIKEGDN